MEEVEDDEITKQVDQKEYLRIRPIVCVSILLGTWNLVLIPGKDQNAWHNDC